MRQWSLALLLLLSSIGSQGQITTIYDKNVKTVLLRVNEDIGGRLPVLKLGDTDVLHVSFDELSHDYHRYIYRIEHLNADFQPENSLLESDYVKSIMDEGLIEEYEQSMNTSVLYTHYSFSLPNDYMTPLLSGNYALTVYCDDEDEPVPVFKTFFYIAEDVVSLSTTGTTNTEIDKNAQHQQLTVHASWEDLTLRDPETEIKLVILQNNRWDNAIVAPSPTTVKVNSLKWEYCRDLIFDGGNEYRKLELTSTRYPGLHIDKVRYYEPYYHVAVMTDGPRANYLYDEDQNGRFVPLADSSSDADVEAEYVWMHFTLDMEELGTDKAIYLNGSWTYDLFSPEYQMQYNSETNAYEASIFLKQGYYSYQYLVKDKTGETSLDPVEGNYYQTENEYTFLFYYRQAGARYDRLAGWRTASYRP